MRRRPLAVSGLALVVFLAALMPMIAAAGARRTATVYDRFDAELAPVDANVQFEAEEPPEDALERIAQLPGVEHAAEGATILSRPVGLDLAPFEAFGQGTVRGDLGVVMDRPRLRAGRLPTAADEAMVASDVASTLDLTVGEALAIETLSPEAIERVFAGESVDYDGPTIELRVVGIGDQPETLTGGGEAPAPLFVVAPPFFERWAGRVHRFDGIHLVRLDGSTPDRAFAEAVRSEFSEADVGVYFSEIESRVRGAVSAQTLALLALALVAGISGAVVAGQAAARFVRASSGDQRVLRTLGFASRDLRAATICLALIPCLFGVGCAVLVSFALSSLFPTGQLRQLEADRGVAFDALVALGVFVELFVATTASVAAFGRERAGGERRLRSAIRLGGFPPAVAIGIRHAAPGGPAASATTARSALLACAAGMAGVAGALVFGATLDRLTEEPARFGWNWDLAVALGDDLSDEDAIAQAERIIDERVGAAMYTRVATKLIEGREVVTYGIAPMKGDLQPSIISGRPARAGDEVVLGARTMGDLGVGLGDVVTASAGGRPHELHVVGQGLFPTEENDDPTAGAALPLAAMSELDGQDGYPNLYVRVAGDTSPSALADDLGESVASVSGVVRPGLVANLDRIDLIPYVLAAYLALLAAAAATHALLTALRSRRTEIAVLKTIGFVRAQVATTMFSHGAALAAVGIVLGIPTGVLVGRAAWHSLASVIGLGSDAASPLRDLALIAPVGIGVALAVAALPAVRAARTEPAMVLRDQ